MPRGNPSNVINGPYGSVNPVTPAIYRQPQKPQTQQRGVAQGLEQIDIPGLPPEQARAVSQLQRNIEEATTQAKSGPFANGNVIRGVTFVNGSISGGLPVASTLTVIQHGLKRVPVGYMIVDVSGGYFGVGVVRYAWDDKTISLFGQRQLWTGSTALTVSVFVF